MIDYFQSRKKSLFFIVILLFILIGVVYFVLVSPDKEALADKKSETVTLETEVEDLQAQIQQLKETDTGVDESDITLKKKVPLTLEMDTLMNKLYEIELVSGTKIEDYSFSYGNEFTKGEFTEPKENKAKDEEKADEEDKEDRSDPEATDEDDGDADVAEDQEEEKQEIIENKPDQLKVVTVQLNVAAPDFEHLKEFLTEVEKQRRIAVITNLSFERADEEALVISEEPVGELNFKVNLSTFYYDENGGSDD